MKVLVLFDLPRAVHPDETFTMKALREQEDRPTEADVIEALKRLGHQVDTLAVYDDALVAVQRARDCAPDVVFNLCESFFNERSHESNIPALLELLRIPYTGAGTEALLLCKDKELAKTVLAYHRIRVPHCVVSRKRAPRRSLRRFNFPAFVKPLSEESSDGIAKASFGRNEKDTIERTRYLHEKLGCDVMIEEYVDGRELYIGVLGNRKMSVLPARELFFGVPDDQHLAVQVQRVFFAHRNSQRVGCSTRLRSWPRWARARGNPSQRASSKFSANTAKFTPSPSQVAPRG